MALNTDVTLGDDLDPRGHFHGDLLLCRPGIVVGGSIPESSKDIAASLMDVLEQTEMAFRGLKLWFFYVVSEVKEACNQNRRYDDRVTTNAREALLQDYRRIVDATERVVQQLPPEGNDNGFVTVRGLGEATQALIDVWENPSASDGFIKRTEVAAAHLQIAFDHFRVRVHNEFNLTAPLPSAPDLCL